MHGKGTSSVHGGKHRDRVHRGINTPIYTSSSYEYLDRDDLPYPRYFNTPNQHAVVRKMCELEGAEEGVLFASGMAAMSTTVLALAGAGDHVVMQDELYGGTHAFASESFSRLGIACTFVGTSAEAIERALTPKTRVIVIESPTNPLLGVIDIRRVAELARARNIKTVIDNTFATPIQQNPLALGIDVVVHSGTKYLGGHSDLCCGVVLSARDDADRIRGMARHLGGSLDANACYLLERSLKTLSLRVERQTQSAGVIARFLQGHPAVRKVNYPGLASFEGHAIASAQMRGFGGMLSFELHHAAPPPEVVLRGLELITPAVSLGGVESLICSPAQTSHAKISAAERERIGISDSLLRLSVGIEDVDDLVADLEQALSQGARGARRARDE